MNRGTVICYNGDTLQAFTNDLPSEYVVALTEDSQGGVWITFRGGHVCRIQNGDITHYSTTNGLPAGYEGFFAKDSDGSLWFGKGTEAGFYRDGNFKPIIQLARPITGLVTASAGGIWISSGTHLFHADRNGAVRDCGAFTAEPANQQPTPLLEDASHAVWIGTTDQGLFRYDGSDFENVPVSNDAILSLFQDREQNVWVGTDGGGLDRINPRVVTLEGQQDGLTSDVIRSLCEDGNGWVWAATKEGAVICQSNGVWHTVLPAHGTPGDVSCVSAAADGAIWMGTQSGLLHRWRAGQLTTWGHADGLSGRVTRAVLVSKSGDVWLGEEFPNAVQCFRNGKFITYNLSPEFRAIRPIVEDSAGNIWVGSSKGMLLRFTGDDLTDETYLLTTNRPFAIRSLNVTPDGAVWVGFAGAGIGRLKDGHFKRISTGEGLPDGYISQMIADNHGWVWVGADSGIFKVRLQDLNNVAEGRANRVESVHYNDFPALQANFGNSPASLRSSDGRLWMPMLTALAVIDPNKVSEDESPANPLVSQVSVDDAVAAADSSLSAEKGIVNLQRPGAKLNLPAGHHRLEFDFTALSFRAPENVQFRYRLVGLDTHWIEAGTQRTAVYPQVAAGSYEFQVAACNSDGIWSATNATMPISIAPFYWQTWWFRIGALLVLIGIVRYVSLRHLRTKLQMLEQQAALDKERMRIAKDLHDDLGTRLTKIVLLSGLAQRDQNAPDKAGEHLRKLSAASQQVIGSLDETVWAVNPRNNTLPHLINYIGRFALEFLKTAEIHCTADLPEHPPNYVIPAAARHNLFLSVKEALNNVVRHSDAGTVKLRITTTEQLLQISIEDDGCGFAEAPDNDNADGLRNMRQRLEEIGGTFQLTSEPRSGTKIVFTCPCNGKNGH